MNILLLGSGGREDALAWRLRQSVSCDKLVAAPGNPGIARWADCIDVDPSDRQAVVDLARRKSVDLVVVGPEAPLVAGVADSLREAGFVVFGPSASAAQLEGSKGFTKDLCRANNIPTADYVRVTRMTDAYSALSSFSLPVVIKADGLAAGKGVTVAMTREQAEQAIAAAGDGPLVIEEFLDGEEASLFALVDGETAVPLASAQDHKRVGEGDTGPNTGGMGAYAPAPVLTAALQQQAMDEIVIPTARALAEAGTPFSGVLYAGLMLTADGPKLIEYNVRFGDPECEAIMPLIEGDFAALLYAVASGGLANIDPPSLLSKHSMTVIIAARGYPGTAARGGSITAIDSAEQIAGVNVFHAGTTLQDEGLVASGGRVLAVTALADTFAEARARAYQAIDQIDFADGFHRRDIGWRELARGAMNALWTYFWPCFAAGLLVGGPAGAVAFRRPSRRNRALGIGVLASLLLTLVWHGPLGGADRFAAAVQDGIDKTLVYYEMRTVTGQLHRAPLSREVILKGQADEFQKPELVRLVDQIPGVAGATWSGDHSGTPLIVQGLVVSLLGFLFGLLLAYLVELRRRYNAQWKW